MADGLAIQSTDDAWPFHYELLGYLAERGLAVRLNDDEDPVMLSGIEGDPYTGTSAKLRVHRWDAVVRDYPSGVASFVPLFNEDGTCAVITVTIL